MIGIVTLAVFMIIVWVVIEEACLREWQKRLEKARKLVDEADLLLVELIAEIETAVNLKESAND